MPEDRTPQVFTIPVYRSFADALVNGLLARHGGDRLALAQGVILVPTRRAGRSITEAFVRRAEAGLLLPRIVPIGDVGEAPAAAIEAEGPPIPAAVDPLVRRLSLARLIQQERALSRHPVGAAEAMRLATELAGALDELIAADRNPADLTTLEVADDLADHWQASLALLGTVIDRWPDELARLGCIDLPDRRNRTLRALAARWRSEQPTNFVVAAGITTAAPAVGELLHCVARLPHGAVVLPGVDLSSPEEEWAAIAGDDTHRPIETHPQHHLRLMLDSMGVDRREVVTWRWGDGTPSRAVRRRVVSNAFAPARFTAKWIGLKRHLRALPGVRLAAFASPADEAQGIAIALRETLEVPGRTAALVTPDRRLAARVVAHLRRWGIEADDSAGQPLAATPIGVLIQAVAQVAVERFAPASLLAVLKHPLVGAGEGRLAWLEGARWLDLALRGPRPAPELAGIEAYLRGGDARQRIVRDAALSWWREIAPNFAEFEATFAADRPSFGTLVSALREQVALLSGDDAWSGVAGRAAADLIADVEAHHAAGPLDFDPSDLLPLLRQLLGEVAVRPPQGGHPRVAIWGLLEARLQQADLLVLGGLNEGVWPAASAADPWLSPRVRRELGLADPERRVGLAAHDLATALGAREVLLTRATRDARSRTVPSRFLLRLEAMTGGLTPDHRLPLLARLIDATDGVARPATRPAPSPPVDARPRRISVTEVDRLKADPYAFYARAMLRLNPLDAVDAEPGPAWRGSAVHDALDRWMREDQLHPDALAARIAALLDDPGTHPLVRTLWQPRLVAAIEWIAARIGDQHAQRRVPIASECDGTIVIGGVELRGRADRIDRLPDGRLAIVDYKSGKPPSGRAVAAGYSMQLGLLAAIAEAGGFPDVAGKTGEFEYWSLARNKTGGFGAVVTPVGGKDQIAKEDFVARATDIFAHAAGQWLTGDAPFTAKLVPDYAPYEDYDQLMRRDEWYGRED